MDFEAGSADGLVMTSGSKSGDDRFLLCVHLRTGDVERTPYRSYEEARYVGDLIRAASRCGQSVVPPENTPFIYVFPPAGDVTKVEIVEG
jgi:hypothetical protein